MNRPTLRSRWTRPLWSFHGWLGLLLALPLILVSLTGALLVRYDWIERGFDRSVFRSSPATNAAPLAVVIQSLAETHPGTQVRFLERPGDPTRNLVFSLHGPGLRRSMIVESVTGDLLLDRDEMSGPRRWMLRFHESLLAGGTGELVVALCSIALLGLTLSGLWINRGAVRGLLRVPRIRGRSVRLLAGEWHRWIGVISLPFLLIWALTGAWLTLPSLPGLFAGKRPGPLPAIRYDWSAAPALEPMLAEARRKYPESELDFLSLPRVPGEHFTLTLLNRDRWFWHKIVELTFDGQSGSLSQTQSAAEGHWLMKLNLMVAVLHFGHLGGTAMKWFWLMFGFAPALLAVSGTLVWWNRRRH